MPRSSPRLSWLPPLWVIGVGCALLILVTAGSYVAGLRWASSEAADTSAAAPTVSPSSEEDGGDDAEDEDEEAAEEEDEEEYPAGIDPERFYVLENVDSGKAVDVFQVSTENNAVVAQWDTHGNENQQFRFRHVEDGFYEVIARHSEKVLQIAGESSDEDGDDDAVTQLTSTGTANQHWAVEDLGGGVIQLLNRATGEALEASGDGNGDPLEQDGADNDDEQRWRLIEAS